MELNNHFTLGEVYDNNNININSTIFLFFFVGGCGHGQNNHYCKIEHRSPLLSAYPGKICVCGK